MNDQDVATDTTLVRIGVVLSVLMVLVGSIQFARYDWTGLPLQRAAASVDRRVGECDEMIRPYVTGSGRVISPTVIDEQQYLSMIEVFRGVPEGDVQVECFYEPFTRRVATPWIASLLPFEEGLALGLVNMAGMLVGLWLVLATLRSLGNDAPTILAVGLAYAVGWNTLAFGTTLLVEPAPLAISAWCWFALVRRRPWWTVPVIALGVMFKETTVVLLAVVWASALFGILESTDHRSGDRTAGGGESDPGARRFAPAITATVVAVVALLATTRLGPEADAVWPSAFSLSTLASNLDPVGVVVLVLGLGPLFLPAVLWWWGQRRAMGLRRATLDPATIGVICGLGLLGWSALSADLSPRHAWLCFPFAATLAARWFRTPTVRERLLEIRMPVWLVSRDPAP